MNTDDGNTGSEAACSVEGNCGFVSSCALLISGLITALTQQPVLSLLSFFTSGKDVIHPGGKQEETLCKEKSQRLCKSDTVNEELQFTFDIADVFPFVFPSLMFLFYVVKMTAYAHETSCDDSQKRHKVRELLSKMKPRLPPSLETKTELKEAELCIYITSKDSNVTPNIKTDVLFTN